MNPNQQQQYLQQQQMYQQQQGMYPQQGMMPQQGMYPPQQGMMMPQQGMYPPQQGMMMPQQGMMMQPQQCMMQPQQVTLVQQGVMYVPTQYNPNLQFQQMQQPVFGYQINPIINKKFIKKQLPNIYRQFDRDVNGLDYNEYFNCIAQLCMALQNQLIPQDVLTYMFYKYDSNRFGRLQYHEFKRLVHELFKIMDGYSSDDSYEKFMKKGHHHHHHHHH